MQLVRGGTLTWELCGGLHLLHCPLDDAPPTLQGGQKHGLVLIDDILDLPKESEEGLATTFQGVLQLSSALLSQLKAHQPAFLFCKYPSQHGSNALLNSAKVIVPHVTIPVKEILTIHTGMPLS